MAKVNGITVIEETSAEAQASLEEISNVIRGNNDNPGKEISVPEDWTFSTMEWTGEKSQRVVKLVKPDWMQSLSGIIEVLEGEQFAYPILAGGGFTVKIATCLIRPMIAAGLTADQIQESLNNWTPVYGKTGQVQSWSPTGPLAAKLAVNKAVQTATPEEIQAMIDTLRASLEAKS